MNQRGEGAYSVGLLLATAVLAGLSDGCLWQLLQQKPNGKAPAPVVFSACVYNNSANFDCIGDCVYYGVKHGLEICYCYYRDCAHRNNNFSFTVSVDRLLPISPPRRHGDSHRQHKQHYLDIKPLAPAGGDCRRVYTYDPMAPDNVNDKLWLKVDPYRKTGEICLNGFSKRNDHRKENSNNNRVSFF